MTNNPSSAQRRSRMVGKMQVNSAIEKATTMDPFDANLRNSGAIRNLSLAGSNKLTTAQQPPGTYPNSTKDHGRKGAGTSLVQNLN